MSGAKLGRKKSGREALIRNQLRSLFNRGFVVTTTPKAKVLKSKAESFLNKAKEDSLESKKLMHTVLGNSSLVEKASEYLQKAEVKVGIVKVAFRDGDNAETSKVTLLGYSDLFETKKGKKKTTKGKSKRKKGETEVVEEKKDEKFVEKGEKGKGVLNLKDKFISKERARSRSGI